MRRVAQRALVAVRARQPEQRGREARRARSAPAPTMTFSQHGQVREQADALQRARDPEPRQLVRARAQRLALPASPSPASGAMNPQMTLNSVVLPAPLGPMTPTTSPAATVERDVLERGEAAEAHRHAVHTEIRHLRCANPRGGPCRIGGLHRLQHAEPPYWSGRRGSIVAARQTWATGVVRPRQPLGSADEGSSSQRRRGDVDRARRAALGGCRGRAPAHLHHDARPGRVHRRGQRPPDPRGDPRLPGAAGGGALHRGRLGSGAQAPPHEHDLAARGPPGHARGDLLRARRRDAARPRRAGARGLHRRLPGRSAEPVGHDHRAGRRDAGRPRRRRSPWRRR